MFTESQWKKRMAQPRPASRDLSLAYCQEQYKAAAYAALLPTPKEWVKVFTSASERWIWVPFW